MSGFTTEAETSTMMGGENVGIFNIIYQNELSGVDANAWTLSNTHAGASSGYTIGFVQYDFNAGGENALSAQNLLENALEQGNPSVFTIKVATDVAVAFTALRLRLGATR